AVPTIIMQRGYSLPDESCEKIGSPAGPPGRRREARRTMVFQKQLSLSTRGHRDLHDLTEAVARVVAESKVRTGVAHVFVVGSTPGVGTTECERGRGRDRPKFPDRLIPPSRDYGHEQAWHDGNGHSHLQATLLGPSLTVPVAGGRPVLGTWQQVFLLECDTRPRDRTVVVTVMGDA